MIGSSSTRRRLLSEQQVLCAQRNAMNRDLDAVLAAAIDVATDDEHDPDGATIAWERQRTAALIQQVDHHLSEIQHALERLDAGTYGRCERCGRPIATDRLDARPTVRDCIDCATRRTVSDARRAHG